MTQSLPASPRGLIVAAVAFDDKLEAVLETGAALARRFDLELRIVNVVGSLTPTFLYADAASSWQEMAGRQDLMRDAAHDVRARLAARLGSLGLGERGGVDAIFGAPDSAVIDYAKIADDLEPSTEEAVRRAFEIGRLLGGRVRQLHVHGDFRELAHRIGHSKSEISALARCEREARVEALERRAVAQRKLAEEQEVEVELDVRMGDVPTEIEASIREFEPDLVVFGRHKILRSRPFLIGRMPFQTMLKARRPVLVVPAAEQLYANLPTLGSVPAGAAR